MSIWSLIWSPISADWAGCWGEFGSDIPLWSNAWDLGLMGVESQAACLSTLSILFDRASFDSLMSLSIDNMASLSG